MRALSVLLLIPLLGLAVRCGGTSKEPSSGGGSGQAGLVGAGGSSATEAGSRGDDLGGVSGASPLVDCDARKVMCKRVAPECGSFEVPSVENTCYGPCVKIERCACQTAEQCPDSDQFTCWSRTHCGPYVR